MILENILKARNYRDFEDSPQVFGKIFSIHIIIGKINFGKSSLIDLIEYTTNN